MQVVDLQDDKEFQALGVELLSIAPDAPEAWAEAAANTGSNPTPMSSPTRGTRSPRPTT